MAAVELTYRATEYDLLNRTTRQVVLIGEATLTGVGVGGGPIIPPPVEGGGSPPGIWGPPGPWPTPPIHLPPIVPIPPDVPNVPPPGSPPIIVQGTSPTQPIVPPSAVVIEYPGIGKVVVPKPVQTGAEPKR